MGPPSTTSVAPALRNRWVVRQIWRAFPELDPYTDDECRTFVRAVRRERVLTAIRALLLAASPITAVVGSVIIAALVYGWLERYSLSESALGSTLQLTAVGLSMAVVGLLSAFACLVLRDWLLRRRLRAVLGVGGHCRGCGYSFIGLIIPETLRVRCPECGMECTVDGSLTLLSRGPDGSAVGARRVVVKTHPPFWTRERIRWWLRAGAMTTAILLTPILIGLGVLEYAARKQAALAEAGMPTVAEFTAVVKAAHPNATLTKEPQFMGVCQHTYAELLQLRTRYEQSTATGQTLPSWRDPEFTGVVPDYDVVAATTGDSDRAVSANMQEFAAAGAWAAALLDLAEADGTITRLKTAMERLPYEVRDADATAAQLFGFRLDYLGSVRHVCFMLCARARVAVANGDTDVAQDSLMMAFRLANLTEEQPFLVEGLVASYIKVHVYNTVKRWLLSQPTQGELDAIERIMQCPGPRGDPMLHVDFEELWSRGFLSTTFSDVQAVRRLLLMGDMDISRWRVTGQPIIKDAGSWEDNRAELLDTFRDWRTALTSPMSASAPPAAANAARGPVAFAQSLFLMLSAGPIRTKHAVQTARITITVMMALERWRLRHGQYPETLDALVPEVLPAVPLDPWSEQPMGYRRMDPAADLMHLPYLLYSHGKGGKPGPGPTYDPSAPLSRRSEGDAAGQANALLNLHLPIPREVHQKPAP